MAVALEPGVEVGLGDAEDRASTSAGQAMDGQAVADPAVDGAGADLAAVCNGADAEQSLAVRVSLVTAEIIGNGG
jgi:hypothetical protein